MLKCLSPDNYRDKGMTNSEQHVNVKNNKYRHMKTTSIPSLIILTLIVLSFTYCSQKKKYKYTISY